MRLVARSSSAMRVILGLTVALGAHALGVAPLSARAPRSAHVVESAAAPAAGSGVMTLTRFMIDVSRKDPSLQDLESLMSSIQMGCKTIASLVQRAGINNLSGLEGGGGSINVQGEEQKKLDVVSNDVLKNALQFTGKLGVVASEEEDRPVLVEEAFNSRCAALPLPPAHTTVSPRECMSLSQRTPPRALVGLGADTLPCSTRSTARPTSTRPSRLAPFLASSTA
jgi:hypothetical protein